MAVILQEPFNDLTNWVSESSSATIVAGRNGTGMQLASAGARRYDIAAGLQGRTITVGFACKVSNLAAVTQVCAFRMLGPPGIVDLSLQVLTTGAVEIRRGTSSAIGTSAAGKIVANTWAYIEASVFHANSGGTYQVRVNNTTVIGPGTGDTNNALNDTDVYTCVALAGSATVTALFDDLYLRNDGIFEGDHAIGAATVKVYNGSAFVDAPVRVWNGSAFVDAVAVKTWNGSAWV